MINIINKQDCCGCSSCEQICPKKCIKMVTDLEGFWYPEVDEDLCIGCGKCEKSCPVIQHKPGSETKIIESYAAYCRDKNIRLLSSSGGMFSIFAERIINDGGIVYGAAFDEDLSVKHIGVESITDLQRLRGSKYLQSAIGETYRDAEAALKQGRTVLFSGTACQIEGLKAYLKKDYNNLYTIDVLCHGVPSPKVWKKYLSDKKTQYNSDIKNISFRQKKTGWKNYSVEVDFVNGMVYCNSFKQDTFMKVFLSNICLRPSCYECRFKNIDRQSDITIGDCWGVESHSPEMDDDLGTSVVVVHTEKGRRLLDQIREMGMWKQEAIDLLLPPTSDSRISVKKPKNREKFFRKINTSDESLDRQLRLLKPSVGKRIAVLIKKLRNKIKRLLTLC